MVDTPIPRKSEDCVVNNYGRELLDLCIASRLRIINGRIRPDNNKGVLPLEEQAWKTIRLSLMTF